MGEKPQPKTVQDEDSPVTLDDLDQVPNVEPEEVFEDSDDEAELPEELLDLLTNIYYLLGTLGDLGFTPTITKRDRQAMLEIAEKVRDFVVEYDNE